jgi:hypothetical protein
VPAISGVPEPSSLVLFSIGCGMVATLFRTKRKGRIYGGENERSGSNHQPNVTRCRTLSASACRRSIVTSWPPRSSF